MGTVGSAKGIIDIDVAEGGQGPRKRSPHSSLPPHETEGFQGGGPPPLSSLDLLLTSSPTQSRQRYTPSEQSGQPFRDRGQTIFRISLPFRPSQVGRKNDFPARFDSQSGSSGRERTIRVSSVTSFFSFEGNIEIDRMKTRLPFQFNLIYCPNGHLSTPLRSPFYRFR